MRGRETFKTVEAQQMGSRLWALEIAPMRPGRIVKITGSLGYGDAVAAPRSPP
jgi:hypothetical protein